MSICVLRCSGSQANCLRPILHEPGAAQKACLRSVAAARANLGLLWLDLGNNLRGVRGYRKRKSPEAVPAAPRLYMMRCTLAPDQRDMKLADHC